MADAPQIKAVPTPDENLQREDEGRTLAGLAALGGAIAITFAFMVIQAVANGAPRLTITEALQDAAGEGNAKSGLLSDWIANQHDHFGLLMLGALLQILGLIGFAVVLMFLFHAAKGRRPEAPGWVRWLLLVGLAVVVVGTLVVVIGNQLSYSDFLNGSDHSSQAGHDAVNDSVVSVGGVLAFLGTVALIASWVLISLNAMRVGLLTRFVGFLGVLGGVVTLFLASLPIIQIFWLVITGMTVLQRIVATPPAWKTGRAEPWPTQQEAREARARAAQDKGEPAAKGKAAKPAAEGASPSTSARKRKRRS